MNLRTKNIFKKTWSRKVVHSKPGFTLMELLIVAALFSISALIATSVFSNVQSSQRGLQGQQRVTSDGRYLLETIARSIRTGAINYKAFADTDGVVPNSTDHISTIDQQNVVTCYRWVEDPEHPGSGDHVLQVLTNADVTCSGGTWTTFTPQDLRVDSLVITVTPRSDPFKPTPRSSADCAQPTVMAGDGVTQIAGFQQSSGVCLCRPDKNVSGQYIYPDCFTDMTCDAASGTTSICHNADIQPQVTIFLKTTTKNVAAGEIATASLQTTVVSRIYER